MHILASRNGNINIMLPTYKYNLIFPLLATIGLLCSSCSKTAEANILSTTSISSTTHDQLDDFQTLNDSGKDFIGTGTKAHLLAVKYSYGKHLDQWGKLFIPTALSQAKTPVVVLVHGGGYEKKVTASYAEPLCNDFVSYGFACWNIEYRRLGTGGGLPMTIQDVISAILYLHVLKMALNAPIDSILPSLDIAHVTVVGHSAGAQLASIATTKINSTAHTPVKITRFIGIAGVYNLVSAVSREHDKYVRKFINVPLNEKTIKTYQMLSPITHVVKMRGVNVLLFTGTRDKIVTPSQTVNYARALRTTSVIAKVVLIQGGTHTNVVNVKKKFWPKIRATTINFITKNQEN